MSNLKIRNPRWVVKRSTVSGVVPTIPSLSATSLTDWTQGGWLSTDIMIGEMFANTADDKLWYRTDGGIVLLNAGTGGTVNSFLDLSDAPVTAYTGFAGYLISINGTENGLDLYNPSGLTNSFLGLIDAPSAYTGNAGYSTIVNDTEDGLIFSAINQTFIGLTDTPSVYGKSGALLRVSTAGNSLEFFSGDTTYVDFVNDQGTILGNKIFAKVGVGAFSAGTIQFGSTGDTVNNIYKEITLSAATDDDLITALAAKTYTDVAIASAAGITGYTGNWVTTDTFQIITAAKRFTGDLALGAFNASGAAVLKDDLTVSGDTFQNLTSYTYWGREDVDGSYRMSISASTDMVIEKRVAGSWVPKLTI